LICPIDFDPSPYLFALFLLMKRSLLLLICLCHWLNMSAQTPAYIHFGVRDGLPGNLVYCGLQDRRGLLWFGTDKGLACFDGVRFRTYGLSEGLPDLEVLEMKEDSRGRIWLSCFRQKPCYWYNGRIFTEKQDSFLSKIEFSSTVGSYTVSEDDTGRLWFFAGTGRTYYTDKGKLYKFPTQDRLAHLQKIGQDNFLFSPSYIAKYIQPDSLQKLYSTPGRSFLPYIGVINNRILRTFPDRAELFEWNGDRITLLDSLFQPSGEVFTDRAGQFWICTPAAGAVCFENKQQDLSNPVVYLPGKKLTAMFEDAQGTRWFCTSDEGVYGLTENSPLNFQQDFFPSKNIRSIARNAKGNILVGDDIGNVHIINGAQKRTVAFGSIDGYNLIRQIIPAGRDSFWAASDEGLYLYTGEINAFIHYPRRESFKSILLQKDKVFFAASSSLGFIKPNDHSSRLVIKKRNAWAGNMEGLYAQTDSFQTNWGDIFPVFKSKITAIQKAETGKLWVITPENGLLRATTSGGKILGVEIINKRLDKPILNIQSIFTELNGNVWLATNKGIYGLNTSGHTIWAGTVAGLSKLVISSVGKAATFATFISYFEYKIENQVFHINLLDSIGQNQNILLEADAKNIELKLAGLDYCSRGNLHFMLEQKPLLLPFQWWTLRNLLAWSARVIGNRIDTFYLESQSYTIGDYFPAGKYQIKATAINASGMRSTLPDTWVVVKQPHWYEIIWFHLSLLGLFFAGIRYYFKARIAYQEAQASASIMQLQALQSQMNPHFIGNSINAIQQFLHPPDPIKASEYISLFTRLLHRTMLFSDQMFIPFSEELLYCQEYFKMVELRFEDKFRYAIVGADKINASNLIPSMLLQPILENATIHGLAQEGDSYLELRFSMDQNLLCCTLTDNGLGLKETLRLKQQSGFQRTSKGLEVLRKKINALNRLFELDLNLALVDLSDLDESSHGTRATLTFTPEKIGKATKKPPRKWNLPK
jgi:ligand-binding sensor domain-containing protein